MPQVQTSFIIFCGDLSPRSVVEPSVMQLVLCASETWYLQMLPWMNYNDSLDGVLLEDASWVHAHVWMKTVVIRPVPIAC